MANPTDADGAQGTSDIDVAETQTVQESTGEQADDLRNADIKSHPLFVKMTKQLSALQQAEAERQAAADKAKREAKIAEAQAKGEFEKALQLKDEEYTRELSVLKAQVLKKDLTTELLGVGFTARAAKFLATEYDAEKHESPEAFARACVEDEGNAQFLSAPASDPRKPSPPNASPVSGTTGKINWEEVRAWETGDDPEKKKKARELLRKFREETGRYPYSLE